MAKVRLLEDVAEGGRSLAKSRAAADGFGLGKNDPKYPRLKITVGRRGKTEFRKGLIVEMTEEGALKWIKQGIAEAVK